MNYIKEKIKSINMKKQSLILIIFSLVVSITGVVFTKGFYEFTSDTKLLEVYIEVINNLWIYYIPVVSIYLYLSSIVIDYNFEKRYVYRFKNKNILVKSNIIIIMLYTLCFSVINNLVLILLLLINFNIDIDIKTILNIIISILLQIFVLFIYNLVCFLGELIFYKKSALATLIIKVSVILSVLISTNSLYYNLINNVSLYNYFTISNVLNSENTILYTILLLCFICYTLIFIILNINEKFEYLKLSSIKEEIS